ncbi:MAG: PHP domain-containing protein [Verrucomicrobia bacterium]|jgi:hypothetical protein|nr:PHP domain-containing protein [Verrucomicrobiota bacterium]
MSADLHLHTRFSDGTFTPEELVAAAQQQELTALALTDHDTMEGCPATAAACAAAGIEFLPGIELTSEQNGRELHILGYGLAMHQAPLQQALAKFQAARQQRIRDIVARLKELNVTLDADAVLAQANCRAPGRPHVARALVTAGACATMDEAFERWLKQHRPAWVPKYRITAADAIELIHQAGGAAVLAHPALNRADPLIPGLVEAGLDGIECFHTQHSANVSRRYVALANRLGVLITGGSDCHGLNKGIPHIGTVRLPLVYFEKLKDRIAERRARLPSGSSS